MATAGRAPGFMESAYRLLMRRNSVYVTFILTGAIVGERVVDYSINKIWEANNTGSILLSHYRSKSHVLSRILEQVNGRGLWNRSQKRYEDIPNLGSKAEPPADDE